MKDTPKADLEAILHSLQWMKRSEADASARLARLETSGEVLDTDWSALVAYAASRQAAERVGGRFASRMKWIPFCHHHRFPLYEQVGDADHSS